MPRLIRLATTLWAQRAGYGLALTGVASEGDLGRYAEAQEAAAAGYYGTLEDVIRQTLTPTKPTQVTPLS